jgi:hypothetical protein
MCDGRGGELFKFRPLEKDDAVPTVKESSAWEMRWQPKSVRRTTAGLVNHTHPAAAQFLDDAIVRNGLADI